MKNILLTGCGCILLALGFIGIFLPIWPTTPFVLAAVGCLASTPKLQSRVMRIPFVHEYIRSYRDHQGISRRTVAVSLCFLWGMLLLSMIAARNAWVTVGLMVVGAAVTAHILWVAKPRG